MTLFFVFSLEVFCNYRREKLALDQGWKTCGRRGPNATLWTFDMDRIRIFITQVRVQHRVKTKLHDKQVLR